MILHLAYIHSTYPLPSKQHVQIEGGGVVSLFTFLYSAGMFVCGKKVDLFYSASFR